MSFDINNDTDLKQRFRSITGYQDNSDEITSSELDTLIKQMKFDIKTEYNTSNFYSDDGVTMALLYTTCIFGKARIENYSVSSYNIGSESISVMDASPEDSAQFQHWAERVKVGIDSSSSLGGGATKMRNTSSFIG